MRSTIGTGRWWLLAILALSAIVTTASLGRWQLSRADQKQALQNAIDGQMAAPVLSEKELEQEPALWGELHRRVSLEGFWLHRHTLFLDHRIYQGRPGFWVLTPLLLDEKTAVLVQRGWAPADVRDIRAEPKVPVPGELVRIQGRLSQPPSRWLELDSQTPAPTGSSRIRHNIDISELRQQWGLSVAAVVLQTDPTDAELVRDWPMPSSTAHTNWGYAFQWFAMSAALLLLSIWTLIIRPLRHGRQTNR